MTAVFQLTPAAFGSSFTLGEVSNLRRYVHLSEQLRRCRYFTEEERSMHVEMDAGVTTKWEQTLPDAGATRDMLGLLRQLFGDGERGSFSGMLGTLREHTNPQSSEGQELLTTLAAFGDLRDRVLAGWDLEIRTSETEGPPPLEAFLDWMYGEFLHSDADKAARIERLDGPYRLYEWQFHWVTERLASLYIRFEHVVRASLAVQSLAVADPAKLTPIRQADRYPPA